MAPMRVAKPGIMAGSRMLLAWLGQGGSVLALLTMWELLGRSGLFSRFLLPPFSIVLRRIGDDIWSEQLFGDLAQTLYRTLAGFLISAVLGVIIGILISRSRPINWLLDPVV